MNMTVVYNPKAGTTNNVDALKTAFAAHGVQPTFLPITSKLLHRHIKTEAAKPHAVIVAAGGDGTVRAVAALVQGTKATIGVIPSGTLNHFAKDLAIPLAVTDAVKTILAGKTVQVDVGSVNKKIFINNTSIGLYPLSLRTRAQYDGQIGKWPAALFAIFKVMLRPRRYHVAIEVAGKIINRRTPFVFIGNNPYQFNRPPFVRRKLLTTGMLDVHVIKATSPLAVVRLFIKTLFSKKRRSAEFERYTVPAFTLNTRHHKYLHVAYDGEVTLMQTPLQYKSHQKSLRVIVP